MRKDWRSDPLGTAQEVRRFMKIKKTVTGLLAGMVLLLAAGCTSESQAVYEQASTDLENGMYEEAASGYQQVIDQGEYLAEAYRGLGIAYYKMGEYLDASNAFASALDQEGISSGLQRDVLLYQAASCYREGMYEVAAQSCQQAIDLESDVDSLFLMGKIQLEQDNYEEAADCFDQAYEADPSYEMAIQIYQAYADRSMEADGTEYLSRALEKNAGSAEDYYERGMVYYVMKDYESAAESLTEAIDKNSREAKLLLGDVYLAQNDVDNARTMYQEYIDGEEGTAKGYNGLALCDIEEGDYVSALDNIQKGLRAAEDDEMQGLLFNEAIIYEKQMNFQEALSKFETYLDLYPDDEDAQREYTFLQFRTGTSQTSQDENGTEQSETSGGTEQSETSDGINSSGTENGSENENG